jgi:ATP-dependent protease HslVU (ClpYQ) peptidase subunit
MSHENIIALLSVLISAVVTIAGIIIARQSEKLRTMRKQLSEKKCEAYADAVKMFYSILKDTKAHRTTNNDEMMNKMIDIKRDIFMYGSDRVFRAFNAWLLLTNNPNVKTQLAAFLDFVLEMRRDLCNGKTNLSKHDILLNLTQSEEEARKLFN